MPDLSRLSTGEWIAVVLMALFVGAAIAYVVFGEGEQ
jgi:hypothetical protein